MDQIGRQIVGTADEKAERREQHDFVQHAIEHSDCRRQAPHSELPRFGCGDYVVNARLGKLGT
ncbi:hypothetical protein GCM10009095_05300 [Sphingomonas molluscorum]|nr:hypothetical protein GCM10017606_15750 [Microbacterium terregens]